MNLNDHDQDPHEDDNEGADQDATGASPVRLHPSPLDAAFQRPNSRPNSATDLIWTRDELAIPPISLSPGNIEGIEGYSQFEGWGLEHVRSAHAGLHDAYSAIIETRKAAHLDGTLTEAARAILVGDTADKFMAKATRAVDASLATLKKTIASEKAELAKPVATAVTPSMGQEIRSYVRELPVKERTAFLMRAVREGDAETMGAVIKAKAYLSGIEPSMQATLSNELNRVLDPDRFKRLAMLEKAEERLTTAGSIFVANIERAMGVKHSVVNRLREQSTRAKRSLAAIGAVLG